MITNKLDSDFEGTFNKFKEESEENIKSLIQSLDMNLQEHILKNEGKVKEAESHVTNLRDLNGKLIDQVKENLSAHGVEQKTIMKELQDKNGEFLVNFQKELNTDI